MDPHKKILGIITARGGSKQIPGKNLKTLGGKPLLAYTIEAAQRSGVLDRLILSTDDAAIADVAQHYGCEVPFLRPAELALDSTPHLPVLRHAVRFLRTRDGYAPDYVLLLQPTAPLRRAGHIREAVELLEQKRADSVVSVVEIPGNFNPHWAVAADAGGFGRLLVSGDPIRRRIPQRQRLPKTYSHNAAIYLFRTELLFDPREPNFYGEKVALYVMEPRESVNIDTAEDWKLAEELLVENLAPEP